MTKHQPQLAPSQRWGFGLGSNPQCPGCWGGQILGATQRSGDTGCPVLTQGKVDIVSSRQLWQRSWRKPRTGSAKPRGTLVQHPWGLNSWHSIFITLSSLLIWTTVNIYDATQQIFSCTSSKVGMPCPYPITHTYQLQRQLQTQGYVCTSRA